MSLKEVHMTNLRQQMLEELQRRNYSASTIRGYILAVKQFAEYFGKPPDRLGATHVQRFQWYLLQERKLAPVTVEIRMSALRFFFKKMLKRRDIHFDDLPLPKTPRKLPTILSAEEVRRMIDGTTNLMHRTILMVLYATGVRRTELSLLKATDIDSKRMVVHIRQGKGSRDRTGEEFLPISTVCLAERVSFRPFPPEHFRLGPRVTRPLRTDPTQNR